MNDKVVSKPPALQVVAALIENARGEVLIAQRPPGKSHAGLWEFPGGKIEAGESAYAALKRELHEELGIDVSAAVRVMTSYVADDPRDLSLQAWRVLAWTGTPIAIEASALAWRKPELLTDISMPIADGPIAAALRLPRRYFFTPDAAARSAVELLRLIEQAATNGADLIRLRCVDAAARLKPALIQMCERASLHHGAGFMVDAEDWVHCREASSGVHLRAQQIENYRVAADAVRTPSLVIASCHNEHELRVAEHIGADAVVLSPVHSTRSHPDRLPLGWSGFQNLHAATRLPAYALGGMDSSSLPDAREHGAIGIAGISGFLG